jgi:hypothetical protein
MQIATCLDLHIYLEFCNHYLYYGKHSNVLCFLNGPHQVSLMSLDETSFPPVGYFFSLVSNLLGSAFLTHSQHMDIIHHYFYKSTSLPPHFQNKLYPDLIECDLTGSANSSTFAFEDLSQDVISIILSYVNVSSARNMLLASNMFYFKTCDYLTHCHGGVFEMYRMSVIEQLLPLFTQMEWLSDKLAILQILYSIFTNSVDHALDPLSIFNTFKPEKHKNSPFFRQFEDLIYGLCPFAPCISTREYYYLVRPFILFWISPAISHAADPLKPFEQTILSNEYE